MEGWEAIQEYQNFVSAFSILLNAFLLCDLHFQMTDISYKHTVVLTMIAIFILYIKLIRWFRLHEETSFYIRLMYETVVGIVYFGIIVIFLIACFGNLIMVMNSVRDKPDPDADVDPDAYLGNQFFLERVGYTFVDAMLSQFLVTVGEFASTELINIQGSDNTDASLVGLAWFIFLITCLVSNVVILNMLIAIMSDKFDEVYSKREQAALRERLKILQEYSLAIFDDKKDEKNFLYVAEPENKKLDEEDSWNGKINAIKNSMEDALDEQKEFVKKKMKNVQNEVLRSISRINKLEDKVDSLKGSIVNVTHQQNEQTKRQDTHTRLLLSITEKLDIKVNE